jgi:hypothetical protein
LAIEAVKEQVAAIEERVNSAFQYFFRVTMALEHVYD